MNHLYVPSNGILYAHLMSINFFNMSASAKQHLLRFEVLTMLKIILQSSGMLCHVHKYRIMQRFLFDMV